jgi:hydroxyacylglutathione hydrolase
MRMLVLGFPAGAWATNCYLLAAGPGDPCVIVDPGQDAIDPLREAVREHRLMPAAVLLTHGHIDHVWSVAPVSADFDIPAFIHPADRYRLADPAGSSFSAAREQLLAMTKNALELTEPSDVRPLPDDEAIEVAGLSIHVRHAPGHTEGSVVFESRGADPLMFSGDLLFSGSIGRTDLPGGDSAAMQRSLQRVVLTADDAVRVLPGHGPETTIGTERRENPFLVDLERPMPTRGL